MQDDDWDPSTYGLRWIPAEGVYVDHTGRIVLTANQWYGGLRPDGNYVPLPSAAALLPVAAAAAPAPAPSAAAAPAPRVPHVYPQPRPARFGERWDAKLGRFVLLSMREQSKLLAAGKSAAAAPRPPPGLSPAAAAVDKKAADAAAKKDAAAKRKEQALAHKAQIQREEATARADVAAEAAERRQIAQEAAADRRVVKETTVSEEDDPSSDEQAEESRKRKRREKDAGRVRNNTPRATGLPPGRPVGPTSVERQLGSEVFHKPRIADRAAPPAAAAGKRSRTLSETLADLEAQTRKEAYEAEYGHDAFDEWRLSDDDEHGGALLRPLPHRVKAAAAAAAAAPAPAPAPVPAPPPAALAASVQEPVPRGVSPVPVQAQQVGRAWGPDPWSSAGPLSDDDSSSLSSVDSARDPRLQARLLRVQRELEALAESSEEDAPQRRPPVGEVQRELPPGEGAGDYEPPFNGGYRPDGEQGEEVEEEDAVRQEEVEGARRAPLAIPRWAIGLRYNPLDEGRNQRERDALVDAIARSSYPGLDQADIDQARDMMGIVFDEDYEVERGPEDELVGRARDDDDTESEDEFRRHPRGGRPRGRGAAGRGRGRRGRGGGLGTAAHLLLGGPVAYYGVHALRKLFGAGADDSGADVGGAETKELSGDEVKAASHVPGIQVCTYPELARFQSWDAALGSAGALIVLFLTQSANEGHWTTMFKGGGGNEFFDPLGLAMDSERRIIGSAQAQSLGESQPQYSRLAATASSPVTVSRTDFQRNAPDINTCGRWVACRLQNRRMSDPEFRAWVGQQVAAFGGDADAWVASYIKA